MVKSHKFQWYQKIYENIPNIIQEARDFARNMGYDKWANKVGSYPGYSSCPGALPNYVFNEIIEANKKSVLPMRRIEDELRNVIKDIYGDDYDSAATNTCESALRVSFETLFSPPILRQGDAYRGRYICPYGEDLEFMAGYGRPFPPKYKGLFVDRSTTAGELAVEAKCLANLDSLIVKLVGAKYEVHGIKYNPVALMTRTNARKSIERISEVAERHSLFLTGFESIGYDTPGYGYGEKNEDGIPFLKKEVGELAEKYDVPYVIDSASCLPVIGLSPKEVHADIMAWSMDKVARAPICGLIVGKEEVMVPIRKALGMGGQRYGEVSSHGKARFSLADPGRLSVVGLIAVLKMLKDNPEKIKRPIDQYHNILIEEFKVLEPKKFVEKIILTKSYNMGGTELNYEQTWDMEDDFGIPIFNTEDSFANTNPIVSAQEEMGLYYPAIYSANVFLAPGLGTLDEEGDLIKENAIYAAKTLVKSFNIVNKYAGLYD